jgi:type I restriction enzyme M protein
MLDTDTKRRIDTARDILVGKVPDPKSQVEQITIALIYKFMDDMDAESEEFGGKRKFFANKFARYGWAKLMRSGLGGHEILNLYAEAIAKMPENPGIPLLFRDIFKNAYLPYRDPETLRAFLKIIDEFTYDHSERLGDAFEYLLSVLGSQGDAGQFRTPRHIIDFMVEIIDPKKNETVRDTACGTAGFLISSYKHILKANTDAKGNSTLTPDEKGRLAQNFAGYDISPDMVRLSLVNLYLHGFADPHIYEYDTLTSQDRWNEYSDVILANPPFMSPKGGIKPHNRFSVQSKRSEVLFVDYMAEHLTPSGRAGIIVPEGIIFQSQTAYKQLRKMLVEEYLVAVVSLPAGVFNPYSGVKTSILILDKTLARKTSTIAFFKVENDGFGLGAQRRPIDKNDLPQAQAEIGEYLRRLRAGESVADYQPTLGLIVEKEKIATKGEYNLSGERYRVNGVRKTIYELTELGNITLGSPQYGSGASKVPFDGKVRYVRITDLTDRGELKSENPVSPSTIEQVYFLEKGDLLIARSGSVGRTYLHRDLHGIYQYAGYLIRFRIDPAKALSDFVFHVTQSDPWWEWILSNSKTGTLTNINAQQYSSFRFPLPPLEVQKEIVAEIEGYQKVINGARAVLDNYRPHIPIHPDWSVVAVGDACEAILTGPFGSSLHQSDYVVDGIPVINPQNIVDGAVIKDETKTVSSLTRERLKEFTLRENDIVIGRRGEMGRCAVVTAEMNGWLCGTGCFVVRLKAACDIRFVFFQLTSPQVKAHLEEQAVGVTLKNLNQGILSDVQIPLPPLATQQAIVAEIEAEQALVAANRELIARFEKKIQATLARVWGEGS